MRLVPAVFCINSVTFFNFLQSISEKVILSGTEPAAADASAIFSVTGNLFCGRVHWNAHPLQAKGWAAGTLLKIRSGAFQDYRLNLFTFQCSGDRISGLFKIRNQ